MTESGDGSLRKRRRAGAADDALDELSRAGLLSDGSGDEGDPAAAAAGAQFYAQVD
jgi:hypothetical protein